VALLAASPVAESFWRQALLNTVGPLVAFLFGGLVAGFVVRRAQEAIRRQRNRDRSNNEGLAKQYLEAIRKRCIRGPSDNEGLPKQCLEARIAGQVLEGKLEIYYPDGEARWLWHGVIDLLGVRYYQATGGGKPLDDFIKRHAKHPTQQDIPSRVRELFLNGEELRKEELVNARFMDMLREAVRLVVQRKIPFKRLTRSATTGAAQAPE
jgi:hypothetical protein